MGRRRRTIEERKEKWRKKRRKTYSFSSKLRLNKLACNSYGAAIDKDAVKRTWPRTFIVLHFPLSSAFAFGGPDNSGVKSVPAAHRFRTSPDLTRRTLSLVS